MDQQQIVNELGRLSRDVAAAQRQVRVDAEPRFAALRAECGRIGHVWGMLTVGYTVHCCVVCGEPSQSTGG